jgi:outer membrane receptor protein involved in Fe transport
MRGVTDGADGNHSGPSPTVGVYLDEQPITTIGGTLDIPTYDLARVEALAGPQGTLYGASSEAGTIRLITNKPEMDKFSGGYELEGNAVDHGGFGYGLRGFVNIPVADHAAIRLVAWDEHSAGYIDNVHGTRTYPTTGFTADNKAVAKDDYNYTDKLGARLALGIDLDDTWTVTTTLMGHWRLRSGCWRPQSHSLFSRIRQRPLVSGGPHRYRQGRQPRSDLFRQLYGPARQRLVRLYRLYLLV